MKEKLTIKLGENKGIFSMEVEEAKAKAIFTKFVGEAVFNEGRTEQERESDFRKMTEILNKEISEKPNKPDFDNQTEQVQDKVVSEPNRNEEEIRAFIKPIGYSANTKDERSFISREGKVHPITKMSNNARQLKPRLVFYTCTECNKTSYAQAVPMNGEIVKCICGSNNVITEIKRAVANCNCCGTKITFYVDKNSEFKEIKCRNCDAFIDMKYIEKKDMYISL